jgi:hypothetical protein
MSRRLIGIAMAGLLVAAAGAAGGCSSDGGGGDTSGAPRGELPGSAEAVMYEFYTDS